MYNYPSVGKYSSKKKSHGGILKTRHVRRNKSRKETLYKSKPRPDHTSSQEQDSPAYWLCGGHDFMTVALSGWQQRAGRCRVFNGAQSEQQEGEEKSAAV